MTRSIPRISLEEAQKLWLLADSLALWESRLTDEDRATPGVLDFPRITSGYLVGGASHRRRA